MPAFDQDDEISRPCNIRQGYDDNIPNLATEEGDLPWVLAIDHGLFPGQPLTIKTG